MGEAKRRRETAVPTVYHHTSTLRTNLIWMAGLIELEGRGQEALHPQLGVINSNANLRRDMTDFPPLAWFTTQIDPPNCLVKAEVFGVNKETGVRVELELGDGAMNMIALQRVALGFPIASIAVRPWSEHPGHETAEGRALNESALEFGDNPDHWFVADEPVDVMAVAEFWASRSIMTPKLQRFESYVADIKRMVQMCRDTPGVFIPPSWLKPEQAAALARRIGVPVGSPT